eukprot:CAMPEP_0202002964 /NCGR_PEP_ID=MMETSP0905-20130828/8685_1 /ASSEMBLY_ACC=CAM_ASM_000554 /TAXON_ID=420261 /ORGANISM="Thalassiosira antarctica, Strain CCMP982" /LENGTH=44 /DNA_ID= /DNA_START= /DNA_END= /DNA_ORIENTATION=
MTLFTLILILSTLGMAMAQDQLVGTGQLLDSTGATYTEVERTGT